MSLTFTLLRSVLLWQLFYLFCSSIVINTVIVTAGNFETLKSDSIHHFFRNVCTKSGSLRFKVSGCHYNSIYNNTWTKQVKQLSKHHQTQWSKCQRQFTSHIDKKIFLTFLLTPYLYTCSVYENPSFIIFSAETEYILTRSWYRNINFSRDRIRRIFL